VSVAAAGKGERLCRSETLRRTAEYQRCYRDGSRRHGALLVVHFLKNELGHPRLGAAVSRKVGGAVVRNRLKRWTRDCFRRASWRAALPALDLVVQPKPVAGAARFADYCQELGRLMTQMTRTTQLPRGGR
jgi:ribonuclease P protein component